MRSARAGLLPLLLAVASACGEAQETVPPHDEAIPRLVLEPLTRIGSLNDPAQALTGIGDVELGPYGALYVAQPSDREIRVFAPDGRPLRRIGRRGKGPGEFQVISAIGFLADTLYVSDPAAQRTSFFGSDGEFLHSHRWGVLQIPERDGVSIARPVVPQVLRQDGSGLVRVGQMHSPGTPPDGRPQHSVERYAYYHIDRQAQVISGIPREAPRTHVGVRVGRSVQRIPCAFEEPVLDAFMEDGSGIVVVDRPDQTGARPLVQVTKLSPAGATVWKQSVPYSPVDATDARLDALFEARYAVPWMQDRPRPTPAAARRAVREAGCASETVPPIVGIATTQDGRTLLFRSTAPGDSLRFVVLGAGGAVEGEIVLREKQFPVAMDGDVVVVQHVDALGVPYLTLFQIAGRPDPRPVAPGGSAQPEHSR